MTQGITLSVLLQQQLGSLMQDKRMRIPISLHFVAEIDPYFLFKFAILALIHNKN